ncbi:MAG TPA: nucleotidyltransferase family protein [Candidatus Dormibacteraeota bacterium]|nr:nucleotidyltransferase family protein [Candidatus Dormibacteraeota bacterium]
MSTEWAALLQSASPQPDKEKFGELLQQLEWPAFFALAEDHGVISLLVGALANSFEKLVPQDILQKLRDRHRAQLFSSLTMTAELFRLIERFAGIGLEIMLVKGPALSVRAYGDPGMRQYGDLDLLVRHRDIHRATEVMAQAGFKPRISLDAIVAGKIPGQYLFTRPNTDLIVELHTERSLRYFPKPLPLEALFKRHVQVQIDGREIPALSIEDELVLICIHGAKHFWERLMWVADIAALVSRQVYLDWERAINAARVVGAERMLHTGLRLAMDLLETSLPEKIGKRVRGDRAAAHLAAQIGEWLPTAGYAAPGLVERAGFRMRMRGGWLSGPAYLLRLSILPTEEDWASDAGKSVGLLEVMRRPFRLAKKYGRDDKA